MGFENLFTSTNTSVSALVAERTRLEVIANNIANVKTTRTPEGGPYKRQSVVFSSVLDEALGTNTAGKGVKVEKIVTDKSEPIKIYDPSHPDANKNGYVAYPNIDITREMVDMMTASRSYEANLAALKARKSMTNESFQLLS